MALLSLPILVVAPGAPLFGGGESWPHSNAAALLAFTPIIALGALAILLSFGRRSHRH